MYNYFPITIDTEVLRMSDASRTTLPTNSSARKAVPLVTGVLDYFPAALAEVAKVSKAGNDKHNPGAPLHHSRGRSTDHADSLLRHLVDRGGLDPDTGQRHSAEVAWRALALLQQELEDDGEAPMPRGASVDEEGNSRDKRESAAATFSEVAKDVMRPAEDEPFHRKAHRMEGLQ